MRAFVFSIGLGSYLVLTKVKFSLWCCRCSICLGEYQDKEVLRIMPNCGHNFHLSCIDVWLRKQSTCPVCRISLQESRGTKHSIPVTFSISRSFDNSENSNDHSHHWLLPVSERSVDNINNQGHLEGLPGNHAEPTPSRQPETTQWSEQRDWLF